jgi:hypothetical protein
MFNKHIEDFNKNLIGLREFVDLIDPFLNEKHTQNSTPITNLLVSGVLKDLLSKDKLDGAEKKRLEQLKSEIDNSILSIFKKPIDVQIEKIDNPKADRSELPSIKLKLKADKDIRLYMENAEKIKQHINLLYKNSFISLLSSVEWFFSQILHYYYDKYPESAGIQKKTMTLADLKGFDSISDAEKHLLDLKIEEVLRGNFESWLVLLKGELSLKLGYIDPIKDELIEIYQRRNLLVHNGGIINSIYISKVPEEFRKGIKLKTSLGVDKEYLDNAISKLQKAFILIASELWKNLDRTDISRGGILMNIVYENLLQSRWDICEGLSHFIINDNHLPAVDKVIAQLNFWLCKKRMGNYEKVKREIESTNYSDKKEIFQLGLFALKDDKKSFFEILPAALDSQQLNIERLEEFPIFKEMRESEEYGKFKVETKYFKDSSYLSKPVKNDTDEKKPRPRKKITK